MPKYVERKPDTHYRNLKPQSKAFKEYDGEGLLMVVRPNNRKVWQYNYTFNGKRGTKTLGYYQPERKPAHLSVSDARIRRDQIRLDIANGIRPAPDRQIRSDEITFKDVSDQWLSKQQWSDGHLKRVSNLINNVIYPAIGDLPLVDVTGAEIVSLIETKADTPSTAKAIAQRCQQVFEYAVWKEYRLDNPAIGKGAMIELPEAERRPHLLEHQIQEFMCKLEEYHGREYIKLGLYILMITFVRPSELRCATWDEFDLKKAEWHIPAQRMKMRRDHIVPLSSQAVLALKKLKSVTRASDLLFPSVHSAHKPISDVTFLKALKIMGYVGDRKIVPHGFRHTASTILHEHEFNSLHIEKPLAHKDKNKIRGIYNTAEYLEKRREMMQWYSDHIEQLSGAQIVKKSKTTNSKT